MTKSSIAIAQINPIVGDLHGNAELIMSVYKKAAAQGADILLCPELALTGYPPEDLLLTPDFALQAMQLAQDIAAKTSKAALVFGTAWVEDGAVYNAAIFAADGKIQHLYFKNSLPNYGVFDEKRVFRAGDSLTSFEWQNQKITLLICEDVWNLDHARSLAQAKLDKILVLNASPFDIEKLSQRKAIVTQFAKAAHAPIIYANLVGGQDDLVFDGASFSVDATGNITHECPSFAEGVFVIPSLSEGSLPQEPIEANIWSAMKLGLADYVRKNGFRGVLLGLSGGIDSAITVALAVDALGAENVRGVLLPSPYTSQDSIDDALESAKLLGIHTNTISIIPAMEAMETTLNPLFLPSTKNQAPRTNHWMEEPTLGGNLQARIRGQILMALSNQSGLMVLSTGNKSEIAVGYSTLYGDSCGAYNVLKDVYKTQVYALANWRNAQSSAIPLRSISKAPSAELKPDQKDSDQLPPYDVLDAILALHIEGRKTAQDIISKGFDAETVKRVLHLVRINEYKRRQSCPGVKISSMMFGRDRRFPLTNRF